MGKNPFERVTHKSPQIAYFCFMHDELVKSIRSRVKISDDDIPILKSRLVSRKVRKRQFLLNAGDVCQYMIFVGRGLLRSFTDDENGSEHTMQFATEGWWISDMASFFSGDNSRYNIEALEECEVLLMSKQAMDQLLDEVPQIQRYFLKLMENHIIALQRRINVVQSMSAEETYLKLMEVNPDLINRASQQHIASYLGITPETLSRVRRQVSGRK
jgi:CRP-like cAMP-binding protein